MQNDNYNRGGYIAFLFSMAFSVAFFIYLTTVHKGVDLKEIKPRALVEQAVAGADGQAAAVDVSQIAEPWVENADMATHGKKVYATNCAICHGPNGEGDGPAGKSLNPPPRNLITGQWRKGGDSIALYKTLTDGLPGTSMAAFGHIPAVDRWALVQYIRSITKDKGKDDPGKLEAFAKSAK